MARIGRPESSAIALPRPVVEPPPMATAQSAPSRRAVVARFARGLDRHVHHGAVEDAGGLRAEQLGHALGLLPLLGRAQHQRAAGAQRLDLARQVRERCRRRRPRAAVGWCRRRTRVPCADGRPDDLSANAKQFSATLLPRAAPRCHSPARTFKETRVRNLSEDTITQAVLARHRDAPDARVKEIMTALVQHLHAFAREVELTEAEWFEGIRFLTDVGHITDDKRQEFILLSDTLGLSMLVIAMNNRKPRGLHRSHGVRTVPRRRCAAISSSAPTSPTARKASRVSCAAACAAATANRCQRDDRRLAGRRGRFLRRAVQGPERPPRARRTAAGADGASISASSSPMPTRSRTTARSGAC